MLQKIYIIFCLPTGAKEGISLTGILCDIRSDVHLVRISPLFLPDNMSFLKNINVIKYRISVNRASDF